MVTFLTLEVQNGHVLWGKKFSQNRLLLWDKGSILIKLHANTLSITY